MENRQPADYAAPPAKSQKQTPKHKKKWLLPLLIIIIVAAAVVILFFVVKKKAENMLASLQSGAVQEMQAAPGDISNTVSGSGTLSYASSKNISIPEGIEIEKVYVSVGDTVKKGQKLASVDSASAAGALYQLNKDIDALEDEIKNLPSKANDKSSNEYLQKVQMEKQLKNLKDDKKSLEDIYRSGLIKASCDGVIDTVNIASNTVSGSDISANTPSTGKQDLSDISSLMGMAADRTQAAPILCTAGGNSAKTPETTPASPVLITEKDLSTLTIAAPKAGAKPQNKITEAGTYTGIINWDCQGTFEMGTTYTATVLLSAKDGYAFSSADDYGIVIAGATLSSDTPKITGGNHTAGNKLLIKATFQTAYDESDSNTQDPSYDDPEDELPTGEISEKELQEILEALKKNSPNSSSSGDNPYDAWKNYNKGDISDYSASLPSGSDLSGLESSGLGNASSVSQMTAFTIASGSKMLVSIQINELDINAVEVGQKADITMDALENKTFSGKITAIRTASTDGAASYIAEITLKRKDGMRTGMSASASIKVAEAKDVIVIPIDALQEDGDSYFVFTGKDRENNPTDKKSVETGISDGKNVEITSGLKEGDTIYYTQSTNMLDEMFSENGAQQSQEGVTVNEY